MSWVSPDSYSTTIDADYPPDARYEYHIKRSFSGQHRDDLLWLYLQMHMIDDIVDSAGEVREEKARKFLQDLLESDRFKQIEGKYHVRAKDLTKMTEVLIEMIDWPSDRSPFTNYDELEVFNYRLMSTVARSVVPIIFYEVLSKDIHSLTREYFENCFIQQMMGMQIINLIKDVEEDIQNGQYFFPDELKPSDLHFLKRLGDEFIARAVALRDSNVAGVFGSSFVSGLTHIYEILFTLQL